ncbi:MAG: FAD binding domain-containing protein [bacterium]|nr:FAD binding domain-containing protein [bacterium]
MECARDSIGALWIAIPASAGMTPASAKASVIPAKAGTKVVCMYENIQEYYFPKSIPDAVKKLQQHPRGSAVISTGAINLTWRKLPKVKTVIDISRLGLGYIKVEKNRIRIGAATPLQELIDSKPLAHFADGIIAESASCWSSRLQRNLTPLGGIFENFIPTAEIITALLVFDTRLVVQGKKTRTIPLSGFYLGPWRTALTKEFIRELIIPKPKNRIHAGVERLAIITSDILLMNCAVKLERQRGITKNLRIAVGGGLPIPKRIPELEKEFEGYEINEELIKKVSRKISGYIQPISDFRASAEYRKEVAGVLLRRALLKQLR